MGGPLIKSQITAHDYARFGENRRPLGYSPLRNSRILPSRFPLRQRKRNISIYIWQTFVKNKRTIIIKRHLQKLDPVILSDTRLIRRPYRPVSFAECAMAEADATSGKQESDSKTAQRNTIAIEKTKGNSRRMVEGRVIYPTLRFRSPDGSNMGCKSRHPPALRSFRNTESRQISRGKIIS